MTRKYAPIWDELKAKGHCTTAIPKPLIPRVIRAIRDMKFRDVAYKILKESSGKQVRMETEIEGSRVRFFLIEKDLFNLGDF
jgi:hypothetical protein